MPQYVIRTQQHQTAYYEYLVTAANQKAAESRVLEGSESGSVVHVEYETETIDSTVKEK